QLAEVRAKFENLKAGKIPPPRQANENVMCAGFTRDGKHLWCGTDLGLRVYDWAAVQAAPANDAMPKPIFSYSPISAKASGTSDSLVYAAVEVPGKNALLFGGYAEKICQMDLTSG